MDITNRELVYKTAKQVENDVGPVDILINNAGVVSGGNLLDLPDNKIDLTFQVNVMAHFYTCKAFLPTMIKRRKGHIVTVASTAGNGGACGLVDYCASKFANVGFDFSLRAELGQALIDDQIKTSIVKPYFVNTGMFDGVNPGLLALLEPEYVADKIVEGILLEKIEIIIPGFLAPVLALVNILPSKSLTHLFDFMGGYEFMGNFHALPAEERIRKQEKSKKQDPKSQTFEEAVENNNNVDPLKVYPSKRNPILNMT